MNHGKRPSSGLSSCIALLLLSIPMGSALLREAFVGTPLDLSHLPDGQYQVVGSDSVGGHLIRQADWPAEKPSWSLATRRTLPTHFTKTTAQGTVHRFGRTIYPVVQPS